MIKKLHSSVQQEVMYICCTCLYVLYVLYVHVRIQSPVGIFNSKTLFLIFIIFSLIICQTTSLQKFREF